MKRCRFAVYLGKQTCCNMWKKFASQHIIAILVNSMQWVRREWQCNVLNMRLIIYHGNKWHSVRMVIESSLQSNVAQLVLRICTLESALQPFFWDSNAPKKDHVNKSRTQIVFPKHSGKVHCELGDVKLSMTMELPDRTSMLHSQKPKNKSPQNWDSCSNEIFLSPC